MNSYFEILSVDTLVQLIDYLQLLKDIRKFFSIPYIFQKLCLNENGKIWETLYKRDFSDTINLGPSFYEIDEKYKSKDQKDSIMKRYLFDREYLNHQTNIIEIFNFICVRGYDKILVKKDLSFIDNYSLDMGLLNVVQNGHLACAKYLTNKRTYNLGLYLWQEIFNNGNLEILKHFIDLGVDIHQSNEFALKTSIKKGHLELVKILIEKGANLDLIDESVLLELVNDDCKLECLKYLIKIKLDLDTYGKKLLLKALNSPSFELNKQIILFLIENIVDIHSDSEYALRYVASSNDSSLMKLLIEKGSDPEIVLDWAIVNCDNILYMNLQNYLYSSYLS